MYNSLHPQHPSFDIHLQRGVSVPGLQQFSPPQLLLSIPNMYFQTRKGSMISISGSQQAHLTTSAPWNLLTRDHCCISLENWSVLVVYQSDSVLKEILNHEHGFHICERSCTIQLMKKLLCFPETIQEAGTTDVFIGFKFDPCSPLASKLIAFWVAFLYCKTT